MNLRETENKTYSHNFFYKHKNEKNSSVTSTN